MGKVGAAKPWMAALPVGLRSQLSHFVARNPVDLTLRLSFCRFHGRFHERNLGSKLEQQKALENDTFSRA
ncbi:hypothetical protein ACF1BQ_029125 [Bradyrhizobium sp. RDT10]